MDENSQSQTPQQPVPPHNTSFGPQGYYMWHHPAHMPYWQGNQEPVADPHATQSRSLPHAHSGSLAPYSPYHTFSAHNPTFYQPPPCQQPVPLADSTTSTLNTSEAQHSPLPALSTTQPTSSKRKNNAGTGSSKSKKKAKHGSSPNDLENRPPIPGAGPQSAAQPVASGGATHPALSQASTRPQTPIAFESAVSRTTNVSGADASDVWYFVRGLTVRERPEVAPTTEPVSRKQPNQVQYKFLLCRLCGHDVWHTWSNTDGQTTTIRQHMLRHHQLSWEDLVIAERLKNWETVKQGRLDLLRKGIKISKEPFTIEGMYERLIRWVAADDQSVNVVENPEFRDFILFCCPYITEKDLPHRTRLSKLIALQFEREYQAMLTDIKNSLGRISFTSDVWSRRNMQSFMGVTAHFVAKSPLNVLTLETRLVAFRGLHGSHSGRNLATSFLKVVNEIESINKMSMVTLDNASNNQKMMLEIESDLSELGIPFDHEQNRVRCFPHVINLAVKAGLACLTVLPTDSSETRAYDAEFLEGVVGIDASIPDFFDEITNDALQRNAEYHEALTGDVLAKICRCVVAIRSSGQRREQFHEIRKAGNAAGGWGADGHAIRDIGPLNKVETRWSSDFFMLDRFIEIYPVIERLVSQNNDLAQYTFTHAELRVASDIRQFLLIFHRVQQCVSAEKTPTLSIVLPLYEKVVILLKNLRRKIPEIAHAIDESVKKLEAYLAISRKTKIYALAMALNPSIKYSWMKKNWSDAEYSAAKSSIFDLLFSFEKETRDSSQPVHCATPTRTLVKAATVPSLEIDQDAAYDDLDRMEDELTQIPRSQSMPNIPDGATSEDAGDSISPEELERRADEAGKKRVADEIKRYKDDGLIKTTGMHNLLQFWQVNQSRYPLLYKAALDVLPVQASAVPCERVFSSGGETDTTRRSNLGPLKVEQLQIMKFGFRGQRLTFTDDLICSERELSVLDVPAETMRDLLERNEIHELDRLITESWNGWGAAQPVRQQ